MSWQLWLLIVIGQGLDYLVASGIAWLAIWVFDLTYNGSDNYRPEINYVQEGLNMVSSSLIHEVCQNEIRINLFNIITKHNCNEYMKISDRIITLRFC